MRQSQLEAFLDRELLTLALAATAQRSGLYADGLTETARRPFQQSLRASLRRIAPNYRKKVPSPAHVKNIVSLANDLSTEHHRLLAAGEMKVGHAQKALNLYLKYMWCLKRVEEPPHFPIDAIILKKIPGFHAFRWTRMKSEEEYNAIIKAAAQEAAKEGLSLAQWELREYNRRDA